MGTLQISTSHNFVNTGPILKIQNILKLEWWDFSADEISWIVLMVRYTALDRLTWNDLTLSVDHSIKYTKTMLLTKTTNSNCLLAKIDCIKLEEECSKL